MTTITDAIRARRAQDAKDRRSDNPATFAAYLRREYPTVIRVITRPGFVWQDLMRAIELLEKVSTFSGEQ